MPQSIADFNRLLAEALPHIVWTALPDGTLDFTNQNWTNYSGSQDPPDWPHYVHPEDIENVINVWAHAVTTGHNYQCEFRLRRTDGSYRWHLAKAIPARDPNGKIYKWLGTTTDIHEMKVARQTAQESEQRLRLIADHLPALVSYMGKDGRYRFVNKGYTDWFEVPREAIEGTTRADLVDGKTYGEIRPHEKAAFEGVSSSTEITLTKPSGQYKILEAHYIPDIDPDTQEVRGIIGLGHDITERVRSTQRYKSLTEALPQLIWSATPDGMVDYANERCLEYSGLATQQKFGEGWVSMIHPEDVSGVFTAWRASMAGGNAFKMEYRLRRFDGMFRWFLGRAVPVRDREDKISYWIGTATDIEDTKQSAREIEIAKEAAENANATKSAFLANMSHEIRTPLGVILGFTAMLKDGKLSPHDRDHYIDTINRNGQALTRIIDDILDLAKVEAGRLEIEDISFSLIDLLTEVSELFKEKARQKGIYLLLDVEENVPSNISSDPTRLRQVLINIVGNAIKFTDQGGVRIRVRAEQDADGIFKIAISIKDTGRGINEEQKERLFKPFSQADNTTTRRFGGTGLGLALSKRLAEALGGTIAVDDFAPNRGCTFTVTFVAAAERKSAVNLDAKPKSCYVPGGALHGVKVLVVEDSPDNQFLIKRILTKNGATVELANDGLEGVEKALENQHDIILMDIQMPQMDGYQAAEKLFSQGYGRPIVALTAHAMIEERNKTQQAGFSGHLTKPIDSKELVDTVAYHTKPKKFNSDLSL